jgi:hypothetical protein
MRAAPSLVREAILTRLAVLPMDAHQVHGRPPISELCTACKSLAVHGFHYYVDGEPPTAWPRQCRACDSELARVGGDGESETYACTQCGARTEAVRQKYNVLDGSSPLVVVTWVSLCTTCWEEWLGRNPDVKAHLVAQELAKDVAPTVTLPSGPPQVF